MRKIFYVLIFCFILLVTSCSIKKNVSNEGEERELGVISDDIISNQRILERKEFVNHKNNELLSYKAFSGGVLYDNKEIYATRVAPGHQTSKDDNLYGSIEFDIRYSDGSWESFILDTKDFEFEGELRDPHLSICENSLVLSCFTTYFINDKTVHSNVIFLLDEQLNIVDMYKNDDTDYLIWGNILLTNDGFLLVSEYIKYLGKIRIMKSKEKFKDSIHDFSFVSIKEISYKYANECTLFYSCNKLFCIFRCEYGNSQITFTNDLDNYTNWSDLKDLGLQINAPCAFSNYNSNIVFLTGSLEKSTDYTNRVPIWFKLDINNLEIVEFSKLDNEFNGWGGYTAMCEIKNNIFGIVYFKHNHPTDFYYIQLELM